MEILLYQPEIPQNTGNIVRTCSVTHTDLTLVKPLGFSISDRSLKRAGLDYWNEVSIRYVEGLTDYLLICQRPFYFFSSHALIPYTEISFTEEDILIFGSETSGLPQEVFSRWPQKFYTIPMVHNARCLNLSNSVSIVLYEALRQQNFQPLTTCSNKTRKTKKIMTTED